METFGREQIVNDDDFPWNACQQNLDQIAPDKTGAADYEDLLIGEFLHFFLRRSPRRKQQLLRPLLALWAAFRQHLRRLRLKLLQMRKRLTDPELLVITDCLGDALVQRRRRLPLEITLRIAGIEQNRRGIVGIAWPNLDWLVEFDVQRLDRRVKQLLDRVVRPC